MRWPWSRPPAPDSHPRGELRLPTYPEPPPPSQFGLELRVGWMRGDAALEADVKAFWDRLGLLPPGADPDQRAREVILAGYAEGRLVAVSTAVLEYTAFLRSRMAVYRCAMAPRYRGRMLSMLITAHSLKVLERWSLENPDQAVMGMLAVLQAEKYQKKSHPHRAPETKLSLVGFTAADEKIVVAWFDHALV